MWKRIISSTIKLEPLLRPQIPLQDQIRTTFILKRRYAPLLHKKGHPPRKLKSKHFIYDLVQDTSTSKQSEIDVILKAYIEGLGNAGEKVSVKPYYAYNSLLLPGLAVYATPENIEKYVSKEVGETVTYSSSTAQRTLNVLSRVSLTVTMNSENPWTLQPWHVKVAFRKCGYIVPEDAITLPSKPIKGPDMSLQQKQFYVTVTVNNTETVKVRCILHHWATVVTDRIKHEHDFWKKPLECIFPEDEPIMCALPSVKNQITTAQAI